MKQNQAKRLELKPWKYQYVANLHPKTSLRWKHPTLPFYSIFGQNFDFARPPQGPYARAKSLIWGGGRWGGNQWDSLLHCMHCWVVGHWVVSWSRRVLPWCKICSPSVRNGGSWKPTASLRRRTRAPFLLGLAPACWSSVINPSSRSCKQHKLIAHCRLCVCRISEPTTTQISKSIILNETLKPNLELFAWPSSF